MRKFLIPAILLSSLAATAAPVAAQSWRPAPAVHRQIQGDINQLERRIDRAAERRTISKREATSLRRDARDLQRLYNRFSRDGLDRREVATLERQVNVLHQKLRLERRDWDGRRG